MIANDELHGMLKGMDVSFVRSDRETHNSSHSVYRVSGSRVETANYRLGHEKQGK
jgi:hypothetical protein